MSPIKTWSGPNSRPTFPRWNSGEDKVSFMRQQVIGLDETEREHKGQRGADKRHSEAKTGIGEKDVIQGGYRQ